MSKGSGDTFALASLCAPLDNYSYSALLGFVARHTGKSYLWENEMIRYVRLAAISGILGLMVDLRVADGQVIEWPYDNSLGILTQSSSRLFFHKRPSMLATLSTTLLPGRSPSNVLSQSSRFLRHSKATYVRDRLTLFIFAGSHRSSWSSTTL